MSTIISPSMSLPVPAVGTEFGPQYAFDINNCMSIIDGHTHAAGSGVPITPGAININSALTFNSNFGTNIGGLTLTAQSVMPANNTIYESGTDLYFVDGLGNNVRITQSGGVAGSPGSISNLTPPATATYVSGSKTFVWQSDVSTAANMDAASYLFRNITPNSTFAVTLQPVNALGNNYSLTLPTLPPTQSIMTLDAAGVMSAPYTVDGSSIVINSNVIQIGTLPANSVDTAQIVDLAVTTSKIAVGAITTNRIASLAVTYDKLAFSNIVFSPSSGAFNNGGTGILTGVTNCSLNITVTGIRPVVIAVISDASSNPAFFLSGAGAGNSFTNAYLLRNIGGPNTTVASVTYENNTNGASSASQTWAPSSLWTIDQPPGGGTYNYTLQIQAFNGAFQANYVRLVAIEI